MSFFVKRLRTEKGENARMKVHSAPRITSIFLHFRPMQKSERFFSTNRVFFPFEKLRSRSFSPFTQRVGSFRVGAGTGFPEYIICHPKSLFVSPSFREMEAENCSSARKKISAQCQKPRNRERFPELLRKKEARLEETSMHVYDGAISRPRDGK